MKHECCPAEWRKTDNVTGDHEFDESLARARKQNPDLDKKIHNYVIPSYSFGARTAYSGYNNYGGDT